jgi:hypothetical protein
MKTAVYIYLAVGCGMLGVVFTFVLMAVCLNLGIDIFTNLWVIVIPIVLAVTLNIFLIEMLTRRRKQ